MKLNEIVESEDRKAQFCPFVGIRDDHATVISFPSQHNHCFHASLALPVKLEFQRTYCLVSNHTSCAEYNRKQDTPLPPGLRFERGSGLRTTTWNNGIWTLLLVTVIVVLIAWQVLSQGLLGFENLEHLHEAMVPAISTSIGSQTLPILPTQIQNTPNPTLLETATSTIPIQMLTPKIRSLHALETPIGLEHKLIIHRVLAGESLPSISNQYSTTVEAIQVVNYYLPSPLRIDWLIIVPINQMDIQGLPAFEAYAVKADVAVEILAQQLSIDPALLKLYNGLSDGEILRSGEWVLVPHMGTATP